ATPEQLSSGEPVQIFFVYEGRQWAGRKATIYVNGAEIATHENPAGVDLSDGFLSFGAFNQALPFEGAMDDLQIYSRALSASEVALVAENPGASLASLTPIDSDGDGLSDIDEATEGTDSMVADGDGDG